VVYQVLATSLGIRLERIEMLNVAPAMIDGLAELVKSKAKVSGWL
jgi:protoheme ferro-lyase